MVSTLLPPGHVSAEDVGAIAPFIAAQNTAVPYVLLGLSPHFLLPDLLRMTVEHAEAAEAAVREAGLERVCVGNRHLLARQESRQA